MMEVSSIQEAQSRRAEDRLRVLTEAMKFFSSAAVNYPLLLELIAQKTTEYIGDACAVFLLSEDGRSLSPVAVDNINKEILAEFKSNIDTIPTSLEEHPFARHVIQTKAPLLIPTIRIEDIRRSGSAKQNLSFVQRLGLHSGLAVPLCVEERCLGVLFMLRFDPKSPSYNEADQELAQSLASLAAIAISNAQLYEAEKKARESADKAEAARRESEQLYRLIFDASPVPMFVLDPDTLRFVAFNEAFVSLYGYSREELAQMNLLSLRPQTQGAESQAFVKKPGETDSKGIVQRQRKDGSLIDLEYTSRQLIFHGKPSCINILRDITEQKKAELALQKTEEQLRQAQKMEAIGRLAGGIAHDFNNLLSAVLGYSEMILQDLSKTDPLRGDIEEIFKAGERASELTKQLLLFSRQKVLEPQVISINDVLSTTEKILRRILGEDIVLVTKLSPSLGRVRADPSSVQQIIMNLVVNSRDAMPTGGRLTIETADVSLDETYAQGHLGVKPGPYTMVSVTDTGHGMDKATQARIFEPFFTTKDKSKGTGLGLSTVFGIMQQSGGSIWVYSEPNQGTTFKLYFPRAEAAEAPAAAKKNFRQFGGEEVILLVEDEAQVRSVACNILRRYGYQVIEAQDAAEAQEKCERFTGNIDLLVSDVVMPHMSGPVMAKKLSEMRPKMKILFMSGYTDDAAMRHGVMISEVAFLQKPFTIESLIKKVREVLDG